MAIYGWFTHQKMVIFHLVMYQFTRGYPGIRWPTTCRKGAVDARFVAGSPGGIWGSSIRGVPPHGQLGALGSCCHGGVEGWWDKRQFLAVCGCLRYGETMEVYNSIQLPIQFDGNMMMMMMMMMMMKKQEIWGMHMMFLSDQRELRIEHPWCPESTLGFWPPWRYPWKAKRGNSRGETWVPQVMFCICGCISLYIGYNQKTSPWYTHPEVERIW